jgi:hypothetical protein
MAKGPSLSGVKLLSESLKLRGIKGQSPYVSNLPALFPPRPLSLPFLSIIVGTITNDRQEAWNSLVRVLDDFGVLPVISLNLRSLDDNGICSELS